ncbi:MAG: phosphoribosyltransferase [Candidatus Hydrogenedentes bacterium]|nr:phosphoribosyltransferase [Candidatus Hydrogenedentota bacterium]
MHIFKNREEAGHRLAQELSGYANRADVTVLALPRGGVPVAYIVAEDLAAPLDVFIVRKVGVPSQPELAMGAIASGGVRVRNARILNAVGLSEAEFDQEAEKEGVELERRQRLYRGERPAPNLANRVIILVDDGLATGASMRAAVLAVREAQPSEVVVAVGTAPPDACEMLAKDADKVVSVLTPQPFGSVGAWYEDFGQTSDEEAKALLERAWASRPPR